MRTVFRFVLVFFVSKGVQGLIVPEEVPSLLSLVYSHLPPIKKGTDSRLGWGFRLGEHADIQVMVELGPQSNTRPLGNEKDKNGVDTKRDVPNNLRNSLWAQNQLIKSQKISNTEGGKWLQSWANAMQTPQIDHFDQPIEGTGEIDARLVIPEELEELYGTPNKQRMRVRQPSTIIPNDEVPINDENSTIKTISTTDAKDALDNVEMDE